MLEQGRGDRFVIAITFPSLLPLAAPRIVLCEFFARTCFPRPFQAVTRAVVHISPGLLCRHSISRSHAGDLLGRPVQTDAKSGAVTAYGSTATTNEHLAISAPSSCRQHPSSRSCSPVTGKSVYALLSRDFGPEWLRRICKIVDPSSSHNVCSSSRGCLAGLGIPWRENGSLFTP